MTSQIFPSLHMFQSILYKEMHVDLGLHTVFTQPNSNLDQEF